jgi:hypothetical protein
MYLPSKARLIDGWAHLLALSGMSDVAREGLQELKFLA